MLSALEAETNVPPVSQRNGLRLWGKGGWRAVPVPLENIPWNIDYREAGMERKGRGLDVNA